MPDIPPFSIIAPLGISVIESTLAVKRSDKPSQRRKHHRSRINKKWRKKYGTVFQWEPCAMMFGDKIIVHPKVMPAFRKSITAEIEKAKLKESLGGKR